MTQYMYVAMHRNAVVPWRPLMMKNDPKVGGFCSWHMFIMWKKTV